MTRIRIPLLGRNEIIGRGSKHHRCLFVLRKCFREFQRAAYDFALNGILAFSGDTYQVLPVCKYGGITGL